MVNQGDIIWLDFEPAKGSEQKGYRPALVVSNDIYNQRSRSFAIVVMITSKEHNFPLHLEIKANLKVKGYIMCEQLKVIDLEARKYKKVTKLDEATLHHVLTILKRLF
jgi:mRNA interferase MazF